jgi:putative endonuclease
MALKNPYVYIMANRKNGTIYTGVTSNIIKRVYEHKNYISTSFCTRYSCYLLVYYESHNDMMRAIEREKQIKKRSRKYKIALIESINPQWKDLYYKIIQ